MYGTRPRDDAGPVRLSDPYEAKFVAKTTNDCHD